MNGITSQTTDVSRGVPQGFVLRPLLYVIYINNMRKIELQEAYAVFDIDTVTYSKNTKEELEVDINNGIKLLGNSTSTVRNF